MMKSRVSELQNLWEAILEDASRAFPTLADEFERDLTRLQAAVAHRGIRVFLVDLPEIGKHFDRCLSNGLYSLSGLPLTRRISKRVQIPEFLRGLYLEIFDSGNQLKEFPNVKAIFFVRELTLAFKKGKLACTAEANQQEVESFYAVDSILPEPDGFWEDASDLLLPSGHESQPCPGSIDHPTEVTISPPTGQNAPVGGSDSIPDPYLASAAEHVERSDISRIYQGFSKSSIYSERVQLCPAHLRRALSGILARLDFVSSLVTATLGPYDPSKTRFSHAAEQSADGKAWVTARCRSARHGGTGRSCERCPSNRTIPAATIYAGRPISAPAVAKPQHDGLYKREKRKAFFFKSVSSRLFCWQMSFSMICCVRFFFKKRIWWPERDV
jgi:hypothetical protein